MRYLTPVLIAIGIVIELTTVSVAQEPPLLAAKVKEGKLPPMAQRLPVDPRVVDFAKSGKSVGRYCCQLRTLFSRPKDIRMMTVYGYARLIGFDEKFQLQPDILADFDVQDDRIFTLTLRKGHKWSDGHPFTTEDFRYFWQDVASNAELSKAGPPQELLVDGQLPKFEVIDDITVRYSWDKPNPVFSIRLADPSPLYIYAPAHYLKQFHQKYAKAARLQKFIDKENVSDWVALHTRKARQYRKENPALPTLEPWINTTEGPSQHFVFARNPYFHRVDPDGKQLPYIDEVIVDIASRAVLPGKVGSGEVDLQARYLQFEDATFLLQEAQSKPFSVKLWRNGLGSQLTLYPNLNVKDQAWRKLFCDANFRRALSLGIDRDEINQVLYFGQATNSANTVMDASPLYKPEFAKAWTSYDKVKANEMLDALGLEKRDEEGIRLLPDGRPMEIIVESAGESTAETDAMELIGYHWQDLGVKAVIRTSERDILRRRALTGSTMMAIAPGMASGLATADMNPEELAPNSEAQLNWPMWGQYAQTQGRAGEPPDVEEVKKLAALYKAWRLTKTPTERRKIWQQMLGIYSDQVFSIGLSNGVIQPVVVHEKLRNVPDEGIYGWSPMSFFGVYGMDTFWFEE